MSKKYSIISMLILGFTLLLGFIGSLFMIFISVSLLGKIIAISLLVDDLVGAYFTFNMRTRISSILILAGAIVSTIGYSYLAYISNPFLLIFLLIPFLSIILSLRSKGVVNVIILALLAVIISIPEFLAFISGIFINYTAFPLTWSSVFISSSLISLDRNATSVQTMFPRAMKKHAKKQNGQISFVVYPSDVYVNIYVNGKQYNVKGKLSVVSNAPVKWYVENVKKGNGVLLVPERREGIARPSEVVTVNMIQIDLKNWDPSYWIGKNLYNYKIIDTIGQGGNSFVLKGEWNGVYYAIKIPKFSSANPSSTIASPISSFLDLTAEAFNLINLSKDERLVKLYAINTDINIIKAIENGDVEAYLNSPPLLVMEYLEGGTLMDLIKNPTVSNSKYWKYIVYLTIREVALALNYMHSQGYVHLDVKPQNIFFSKKLPVTGEQLYKMMKSSLPGLVKLGDLGSAVKIGGKITQITAEYAPPEQLEFLIKGIGADPRLDVFALGVTLYTALSGYNNRPDITALNDAIDYYVKGKVPESLSLIQISKNMLMTDWIKLNIEPEILQLIKTMVSPNYLARPSLTDVIRILDKYII
ncbi:protein kinase domain-containing protein [Stygiolobus caldivivus]|uniref:Protein kinase domain-containing protein n=1 Tax=Stygiolobus caldivivus TaxID=2824673 RepID=A0A8D5U4W0_9CREN|nr:protein kinase [Stygiolobus caldivivus]BCU69143.1 hypothetical protein KN1_04400 [Stygiolobus caldivivus]